MIFDADIEGILKSSKSIAIIGAKDKAGSAVEHVGRYLIEQGYEILPVHPVRKTAWALTCYPSIVELPKTPDIICLFRASEACIEHAKEILTLHTKPQVFWMQTGIFSQEAGVLMQQENIRVVEDLCMEVEHKRLILNKGIN